MKTSYSGKCLGISHVSWDHASMQGQNIHCFRKFIVFNAVTYPSFIYLTYISFIEELFRERKNERRRVQ